MRFLFLPLWSASLSLAAVCGPPAAAQREIDALPGFWNSSLPYEQKMAPRRALAAQYPEDYFAQVAAMRPPHEDSQWERNLAHYRAMKDRDAGELLEARLMFLGQGQNPRVTALIQAVVDRRPDLPAARLLMLQTAWRSQAYEQAEAQFREYRQLCPAGIAAFGFLRAVQDNAVWKPALDQAHRLLIGRTDPEAIEVWGEVLTAERVGSDNRTETDLAQLRELALYDRDDWANLLLMHMAYQGDSSGRDALRAELVKRRPDSRWAVEAAVAEWDRTHPHPAAPDAAAASRYAGERVKFLYSLLEKYPDSPIAMMQVGGPIIDPALPDELALRVIAAQRRLARDYPDQAWMRGSQPDLNEARWLVGRKLRLESVPPLVDSALRAIDADVTARTSFAPQSEFAAITSIPPRMEARRVLAECYLLQGDRAKVEGVLGQMRGDLEKLKAAAEHIPSSRQIYERLESAYRELAEKAKL